MANDPRRPWFGPHKVGFGWGPVTWQGYAVTIAVAVGLPIVVAIGLPLALELLRRH